MVIEMSWKLVKNGMFVQENGECKWIDVGLCSNCNGLHVPAEEANGCCDILANEIPTIAELKERFDKDRQLAREKLIKEKYNDNDKYKGVKNEK
jgi:hypothetical protein